MTDEKRKVGRDARTGEFITVEEARRRPSTAVVETIKVPKQPAKPGKKK
jgi:hypothetical protein